MLKLRSKKERKSPPKKPVLASEREARHFLEMSGKVNQEKAREGRGKQVKVREWGNTKEPFERKCQKAHEEQKQETAKDFEGTLGKARETKGRRRKLGIANGKAEKARDSKSSGARELASGAGGSKEKRGTLRPRTAKFGTQKSQEAPKSTPKRTKSYPTAPKEPPKGAKRHPRAPQIRPKAPQERPKTSQEALLGPPNPSQIDPESLQNRTFIRIRSGSASLQFWECQKASQKPPKPPPGTSKIELQTIKNRRRKHARFLFNFLQDFAAFLSLIFNDC